MTDILIVIGWLITAILSYIVGEKLHFTQRKKEKLEKFENAIDDYYLTAPSMKSNDKEDSKYNNFSLEEKTYSWADAEMRVVTYGIFTKDVDVRDKEIFVKIYGRDMCGMNNYCIKEKLIGQQNLKFRIEESTKYFEHICSLNC